MTINLDTLRKTAEAATPGPWTRDGVGVLGAREDWDGGKGPARIMEAMMPWLRDRMEVNAEHVATFDPPTVLELIAEIESLRTRFNGMRAGRDSERSRADKNANALERMEQRALGAEANVEAALNVSRDRLSRLEQAEQAVERAKAVDAAQRRDKGVLFRRATEAEQKVARVWEVIRQYDPDCLTCMCKSDGDCCKCTVADFQEALDGDGRG